MFFVLVMMAVLMAGWYADFGMFEVELLVLFC
jgi:hypothetical protein